ncbi:hypothetical protein D3C85_1168150 [compost metagenome]
MDVVILAVIQIQHVLDLLQGEADTASPQDQLEPGAVAAVIDPRLALARRSQQALVLIEAQGPRGGPELAAQVPDGIGAVIISGRHASSIT